MIVKVCKKHGELSLEQTYRTYTKKADRWNVLCLLCKKEYRNDWAKRYPEKVVQSRVKMRENRLLELKKGILKKICKQHGELPIEKIRVDARGTKVCRYCSNEQANKAHANPEYKKRAREWLYSDPERVRRYRTQDIKNRNKRNIRRYHRIKATDPEKHKLIEAKKRELALKGREALNDGYVAGLLRTRRSGKCGSVNYQYEYLAGWEVPKEIIEIKKMVIKIRREIKLKEKNKC